MYGGNIHDADRRGMNESPSTYLRNGSADPVRKEHSSVSPIENGEIPVSEMDRVNQMIEDISYYNAKNFFKF